MQLTIHGPLTITRISSYMSDYNDWPMPVHVLSLVDGDGCLISHHVASRSELRRIAAPHMLGNEVHLKTDEVDERTSDRDLIRRWINGDDLAFAGPVGSPMQAGAAE
jgi:hypothetical protein